MLTNWFEGPLYNITIGLTVCLGNVFGMLNGAILPAIYNLDNMDHLGEALMIGVIFNAVSFTAAISICM